MEAICNFLAEHAAGKRSWTPGGTNDTWTPAVRELLALGWARNDDRPEPRPRWMGGSGHGPLFPWWTDPETGEDVRGMVGAMKVAFERHLAELEVIGAVV